MVIPANHYPGEIRTNMRGGEGDIQVTPLSVAELPAGCRLFSRIEIPRGGSIGYHVHENETELFYFISGAGRVQDDEALVDIQAGCTMVTAGGHGHAVFNVGEEPLVLLACIVLDK